MEFWKIVTIVIGLFATWISYSQYSINKEKFKLDLFEKRFAIFVGARKLLSIVLRDGNIDINDLYEFRANTAEASFLFDEDITNHLKDIDERA